VVELKGKTVVLPPEGLTLPTPLIWALTPLEADHDKVTANPGAGTELGLALK